MGTFDESQEEPRLDSLIEEEAPIRHRQRPLQSLAGGVIDDDSNNGSSRRTAPLLRTDAGTTIESSSDRRGKVVRALKCT